MTIPTSNQIVGRNIKLFREQLNLTQDVLASYLGTSREQLAYYENGSRGISASHLTKLADIFCANEYDFYETDPEKRKVNMAFAFRADMLKPEDLDSIARFKKIVRNYLNMKMAMKNE